MKIKTLTLALLAVATTSAFAAQDNMQNNGMMQNGMMSPSMEDQDYSEWKEYYRQLKTSPAGATSTMKKMMGMAPQPRDEYDYMLLKKLQKMAMDENSTPMRPFDTPFPALSFDAYWMKVEMKLNAYRRELIREADARRNENMRMRGMSPMNSGM